MRLARRGGNPQSSFVNCDPQENSILTTYFTYMQKRRSTPTCTLNDCYNDRRQNEVRKCVHAHYIPRIDRVQISSFAIITSSGYDVITYCPHALEHIAIVK